MKAVWRVALTTALVTGAALPAVAFAGDKETVVSIDEIPAAARTGLIREAKGASILRVEVEKVKGKTGYEGVIKQGDDEMGIVVDAQGNLLGRHREKNEEGEKN
jgi:uncharacterized membrane protein YkoI